MAQGWEKDKSWSDQFLPEIKAILGQTFIGAAPPEEDMERNTDLIVLRMEPLRIACRIRRVKHFRYADEFTIRTSRPNGTKTELYKIIEGWGDYLFYGFGDDIGNLVWWGIGDLRVFSVWVFGKLTKNKGVLPGIVKSNTDGSSDFRAFKWKDLPSKFVVNQATKAAYTKPKALTPPPTEAQPIYFKDTQTPYVRVPGDLF
jgi:hypothetical protein